MFWSLVISYLLWHRSHSVHMIVLQACFSWFVEILALLSLMEVLLVGSG